MAFWVYILASRRNGTLHIGMTDSLSRRLAEHRAGEIPGFTQRYGVKTLVCWSRSRPAAAPSRVSGEWRRAWKLELIERFNPAWRDLALELTA